MSACSCGNEKPPGAAAPLTILFISNTLAIPADHGGRTYAHALLTHLASRRCSIICLCLDPMLPPSRLVGKVSADADYLTALWSPQHLLVGRWLLQRRPWAVVQWHARTLLNAVKGLVGDELKRPLKRLRRALFPPATDATHAPTAEGEPPLYAMDRAQSRLLDDLVSRLRPAVVMVDYTRYATIFDSIPTTCLKVLLTHDILHQRAASYQRFRSVPDFAAHSREVETGLLRRADTIVAIQGEDAACFREMLPGHPVVVAPMPAVVPRARAASPVAGRCMFVGGSSQANAEGVRWFLEQVWPLVRAQHPAATFAVYGNVCKKLGDAPPGVAFRGPIDDLGPAYAEAELCVVPLHIGSGLKIKLIEAAAHGRAVISTSLGVQGLQALAGSIVPVADEPAQFAGWVARLLAEQETRAAYAAALSTWAAEHLSPSRAFAELENTLRS